MTMPSGFTGFRLPPEVILLAVRWYLRYGLSCRDLEELLAERSVEVDQMTLHDTGPRPTPDHPRHGLRSEPREVHPRPARSAKTADSGVDQPALTHSRPSYRPREPDCLTSPDIFRWARAGRPSQGPS